VGARHSIETTVDGLARASQGIERLYERIATDLNRGEPLIFVSYIGLSKGDALAHGKKDPAWDTWYGNDRFFERAATDRHARALFEYPGWNKVLTLDVDGLAARTHVYHQRIEPSAAWRARGVDQPFDAYVVLRAFAELEDAGLEL